MNDTSLNEEVPFLAEANEDWPARVKALTAEAAELPHALQAAMLAGRASEVYRLRRRSATIGDEIVAAEAAANAARVRDLEQRLARAEAAFAEAGELRQTLVEQHGEQHPAVREASFDLDAARSERYDTQMALAEAKRTRAALANKALAEADAPVVTSTWQRQCWTGKG